MSRVVTILILLIFSLNFKAQNGKLVGKVIDGQTGETLPGAAIVIEGTTIGTASDFDGNFSLGNLKPGKYTILSSYISYDNKKFIDVVIKTDDVTTLNIALEQSSSATLNTVEIQAEMNKENIRIK